MSRIERARRADPRAPQPRQQPDSSPRPLGLAQARVLQLLRQLIAPGEWITRIDLLNAARATGALGVAPSAVEPTLNRVLRDLFLKGWVDFYEGNVPEPGYGLREEIAMASSRTAEEHVQAALEGVGHGWRQSVRQRAKEHHALLVAAANSRSWSDAKRCRSPFRIRHVRLVP